MKLNLDCTIVVKDNIGQHDLVYVLSRFKPTDTMNAYQVMKEKIRSDLEGIKDPHITLMLTANGQVICAAQGSLAWLWGTEVFRTYAGFGQEMPLVGIGFIDRERKIRVAFENGMVTITPIKGD